MGVMVKNKVARFLWTTVYIYCYEHVEHKNFLFDTSSSVKSFCRYCMHYEGSEDGDVLPAYSAGCECNSVHRWQVTPGPTQPPSCWWNCWSGCREADFWSDADVFAAEPRQLRHVQQLNTRRHTPASRGCVFGRRRPRLKVALKSPRNLTICYTSSPLTWFLKQIVQNSSVWRGLRL